MIITVFGATGRVGREIIKQALWQGHTVRAYGRNVHELTADEERHDNLHLVKGGVFDGADVKKAVQGAGAVLSALGGAFDGTDKTRSLGIKTITAAMQEAGVQRIAAVGGMGVLDAPGGGYLIDAEDYPPQYVPVGREHLKAFEYLSGSNLQWTFFCPPEILPLPATGRYQTAVNVPPAGKFQITAGDLAAALLKAVTTNEFTGVRVGISN